VLQFVPRRHLVFPAALVASATACGVDGSEAKRGVEAPIAAGSLPLTALPTTTLPAPVEPLTCEDGRVFVDFLETPAAGEVLAAAELLTVVEGSAVDRPDLARLADDGLLAGRSVDAIAGALATGCVTAACDLPDDLRMEITTDHTVRAVATYRTDVGPVDVVVAAGRLDGRPFVVGIPPVVP